MAKPRIRLYPRVVARDLPIGGTADPEEWAELYPITSAEESLEDLRKQEIQQIRLRHSLLPAPEQSGGEEAASNK